MKGIATSQARRRPRGFTLAEVLMASAVLTIAISAITYAISTGQAQTHDALHELRAVSLAEALMEEIVAYPYADPQGGATPGPDAGETTRWQFDNCDDFHGYEEEIGQTLDAGGQAYPAAYAKFSRAVTCVYDTVNVSIVGATSGLTVTVTVTDERGRAWQALRFIPESLE